MSNTSSVAEDYSKIQRASVMNTNENLFKNISELIEYRKKLAINILKCQDEEARKKLRDVFEMSECHIKQLLGL